MASLESLSTLPPLLPGSGAENRVPFELIELIKKIKNIYSIQAFNPFDVGIKVNFAHMPTRRIKVGKNQQRRNIIFIKSRPGAQEKYKGQEEQIAFMISNRLNLNVVPPTMAIEVYKDIVDQNISHGNKEHFLSSEGNYNGVTVQEGIALNSYQIHLDYSKPRREDILPFLNTYQLCNAIFFNIITGRVDASIKNSIIDELNGVVEVDNEEIGSVTDSWLLDFPDLVLSKKSIENLLDTDISIIDGVFHDMPHYSANFWDSTTKNYKEGSAPANITSNYIKLRKFIFENKEKDIKVSDLATMMFNPIIYRISRISIQFDTYFGQSLVVCGTGSDALDWDLKKALPLKWNPGNVWTIDIETSNPISFKVLLKDNNGELKWMHGNDLNIPAGMSLELPSGKISF